MGTNRGKYETITLVEQLQRCFETYYGGVANPDAIREVSSILSKLEMRCNPNGCARDKMLAIGDASKRLFSQRKHASFPGGAQGLLASIYGDIMDLEDALLASDGRAERTGKLV